MRRNGIPIAEFDRMEKVRHAPSGGSSQVKVYRDCWKLLDQAIRNPPSQESVETLRKFRKQFQGGLNVRELLCGNVNCDAKADL